MRRWTTLGLASALCCLAGCASDANRQLLANDRLGCARGNTSDCDAVPVQEKINQDEANANALKAVAIGILLPLAVVAAAAAADQEDNSPVCYNRWRNVYYHC